MTLILTNLATNEDEQSIKIEWGYVATRKGKVYARFITTENYERGKHEYEEIEIENDNMMLNILP